MAAKQTRRARPMPQRTCVGCRVVNAKRQLVRLVRTADGQARVDPTGKAPGRGAYLHNRRACWQAAFKGKALEQALKMTITEADRATLLAQSEQYSDED
jgi:predicted RNA-binding protein YlxR (DUF448 family)